MRDLADTFVVLQDILFYAVTISISEKSKISSVFVANDDDCKTVQGRTRSLSVDIWFIDIKIAQSPIRIRIAIAEA